MASEDSAAVSMQVTVDRRGRGPSEYMEGPEISGNVAITVHQPIQYTSIEVVIVCKSTVLFQDILGTVELLPDIQSGSLVHLFDKIILKETSGDARATLEPGSYDFPYTFTIQKRDLPSTFTSPGIEGSGVVYYVESLILQEKDATEALARRFTYFPYIGTVDIGDEKLLKPFSKVVRKNVEVHCFSSDSVRLTLQLDRTGYCLGEKIRVNATVVNNSRHGVKLIGRLEKTVKHDVRKPLHHHRKVWDTEIVSELSSEDINPAATANHSLELNIPESQPVSLDKPIEILQVYYVLNVRVDIPHTIDIVLNVPITIGSMNSKQQ